MRALFFLKAVLLSALFIPGLSFGQSVGSYDLSLANLKEKIATQIEKIKTTREYTDSQISLAKVRIEEQIARSEEQLALQLESLALLKEQINTKGAEADATIKKMTSDLSSFSQSALKEIEDQITLTNDMLTKIKALKAETCDGCSTGSSTSVPSANTVVAANVPVPATSNAPTPYLAPEPTQSYTPVTTTSGGG